MEKNHSSRETRTCEHIGLPKNLNIVPDSQNPLQCSRNPIKKSVTPTPQIPFESGNEKSCSRVDSDLTKTLKTKIDDKDSASFFFR